MFGNLIHKVFGTPEEVAAKNAVFQSKIQGQFSQQFPNFVEIGIVRRVYSQALAALASERR
uniref:hypothetical protein n=1 Tax=Pseudomonas sp. TaxID=306 RepID=UPI00159EBF5B|nr:hypothetical protein [Pseudomonas sp.]